VDLVFQRQADLIDIQSIFSRQRQRLAWFCRHSWRSKSRHFTQRTSS